MSNFQQTIGSRIRASRVAAHLTQQELAGQDFSKSSISVVERGTMTPSFQALRILAERLGVSISSLLGEERLHAPVPEQDLQREEQPRAALFSEVKQLIQQGQYEEGLSLCKQIKDRSLLGWAHEQYARTLAEQERFQEAYEQMQQAQVANAHN